VPAQAARLTKPATQDACLRFTTLLLGACLFLQRFALPAGGRSASIVGPIGLALAAWGVWRGSLCFDRRRTALFLWLVAAALFGTAWHAMLPNPFGAAPSLLSLAQFLLLSGFAVVSFAEPVEEAAFFLAVNRLFTIVAVAGIAQFALQFAGVRLFAFSGLLPERFLMESGYNLAIPVGIGDLLKSNGFFLIEPSVFSQFMALALAIEVLAHRRPGRLLLFGGGLLLSFSGTGWIVLASFLIGVVFRQGRRGAAMAAGSALVLVVAASGVALLAPDVAGAFAGRLGEISQPGTSGHMRFVTPFWLMDDVVTRAPSALLTGIGAGVSERLTLPYTYDVNTPIKVFLEYGLPLLILYVSLFAAAARTRMQGALFVPAMALFLFTGGYQQFPPVLFPVLLIVCVARLRQAGG